MEIRELPYVDVEYLDNELLNDKGRVRLWPAAFYHGLPEYHLQTWCQLNARYGVPTVELFEFLEECIMGRVAIEVGAGMGDLGYHLGIRMTDSAVQTRYRGSKYTEAIRLGMDALRCARTKPPPDVERIDAEAAVRKYKPDIVIASWLTQKYRHGDEGPPKINSSLYGADEFYILQNCQRYVHIGNTNVHGDKRILKHPHTKTFQPWIVSRAFEQSKNVIYDLKGARG